MGPDDDIDQAIEAVADGRPINWSALDSAAQSDETREVLKCLRILGDIADLHRSSDDDPAAGDAPAIPASEPAAGESPDSAGDTWGRYRLRQSVGEGSFGTVY